VDRPYITIVEEHQCLAPVFDIAIKKPPSFSHGGRRGTGNGVSDGNEHASARQQRNEILVLSGSNNTSHINIIQNGISIKDHLVLDQIPQVYARGGVFCTGEKIFFRVFGQTQLLVARVVMQQALVVQELDVPSTVLKVDPQESILLLQEVKAPQKQVEGSEEPSAQAEPPCIILVSDFHIKILSNDLSQVLYEEVKSSDSLDTITHCELSGSTLLVSTLSDSLILFEIDPSGKSLSKIDALEYDEEITAICLNQDASTAVVALNDAPDYHIHIIGIKAADGRKQMETM